MVLALLRIRLLYVARSRPDQRCYAREKDRRPSTCHAFAQHSPSTVTQASWEHRSRDGWVPANKGGHAFRGVFPPRFSAREIALRSAQSIGSAQCQGTSGNAARAVARWRKGGIL